MKKRANKISLCWFGDVKIDDATTLSIGDNLRHLIDTTCLNVANFEAPVKPSSPCPIDKSGPVISQDAESGLWLEKNGFGAVSLANNHCMDYGKEGLMSTKNVFKTIKTFGAGSWDDAYRPLVYECGDEYKIAIIACSHCEFGALTDETADSYGYAWLMHPQIESLIIEAKKKCDYVFIFAHAGIEYSEQPLPEIRRLYRHFIDLGCDGVIASHPHIVQGWEEYHEKPIVYSLGNFVFDDEEISDSWLTSICCKLEINSSIKVNILPIKYNPSTHIIDILEDDNYNHNLNRINDVLRNDELYMDYINKYCLSYLPSYFSYFSLGGFILPSMIITGLKGLFGEKRSGTRFPKKHLLNTIRCESHRWTLIRAIKLKYNIKY